MSRAYDTRAPRPINKALYELAEARAFNDVRVGGQVDVTEFALSAASLGVPRAKLWKTYLRADREAQKRRDALEQEAPVLPQTAPDVVTPAMPEVSTFPQVMTLRVSPDQPLQPWHDQEQVFSQR